MSKFLFILLIISMFSIILFTNDNSTNELLLKSSVSSNDFAIAFIGFGISLLVRGGKK